MCRQVLKLRRLLGDFRGAECLVGILIPLTLRRLSPPSTAVVTKVIEQLPVGDALHVAVPSHISCAVKTISIQPSLDHVARKLVPRSEPVAAVTGKVIAELVLIGLVPLLNELCNLHRRQRFSWIKGVVKEAVGSSQANNAPVSEMLGDLKEDVERETLEENCLPFHRGLVWRSPY